jgi:hypothetical protein
MPTNIAVALPAGAVLSPAVSIRDKIFAAISNRDFIVVSIFSAGILLAILFTFYLPFRFPGLGALIEQYNQF